MSVVGAQEEAPVAVSQGRETMQQGRSIMLFTVVTIIFVSPQHLQQPKVQPPTQNCQLPLSFLSSIPGMNVAEFNGGPLTLGIDFAYMC